VERTLSVFTTTLLGASLAQAAHPPQQVKVEGTGPQAADRTFVVSAQPSTRGHIFARQVLPRSSGALRAASRVIYLNHDGVLLTPGDNDSRQQRSSVVQEPVFITPWEVDDQMWSETVACVRNIYSHFDVEVTDSDPGDAPHIEAVFGGHPNDVGLPDNVAGVSPFTTDCGIIENSIVFTFTDVLDDDSQTMCEIMSQEIAHSFGLDHQLTPSDPMTYLDYDGNRSFQNEMATCGEFDARDCGIDGSVCRDGQNSVALLTNRLGARGAEGDSGDLTTTTEPEASSGCSASGSGAPLIGVPLVAVLLRRRRRR